MGVRSAVRILTVSCFAAILTWFVVFVLCDDFIAGLAATTGASSTSTFGGPVWIASIGVLLAHAMPYIILGIGIISAFISLFQYDVQHRPTGRRYG